MNSIIQPIISNGLPSDLIFFLLAVPFVVMVVTFSRHILGLKTLGIFEVVSMSFVIGFILRQYSFFSMLMGLLILIFVYSFTYFIKRLTIRLGLHYFARVSLVISLISISLLIILLLLSAYSNFLDELKLSQVSPFAIIIAVFMSEHFASNQTQKGIKTSRSLFASSLMLALLLGLIISWDVSERIMMNYPYFSILFMLGTLFFGLYKGMRLSELLRFKDLSESSD